MNNIIRFLIERTYIIISIFLVLIFSSFENITEEDLFSMGTTPEELQILKEDRISPEKGTVYLAACHAQIVVPQGFVYIDADQSKKLLIDYWGNIEDRVEGVMGSLVPANCEAFYQISVAYVISYDNCGYIKDDDATTIDYDELMKQIQEASSENNKNLPLEQQLTIKGWAVPPQYIKSTHTLIWAKSIGSINGDIVNYDMRVLGKEGMVSVNAVTDFSALDEIKTKSDMIINSVVYDRGYAYSDFDPTVDRISDWTITGLIAGGALAKSGVLAKLGVFLLKCWKFIVIGAVAIGASIKSLFSRRKKV